MEISRSAIAAATLETGSWRTRHLRLRAYALREALAADDGRWAIRHMAGLHLLADGLTKPLLGPSFNLFRSKLRLHPGKNQEPKVRSCNVAMSVGRVGSWLAVLAACTALIAKGQFIPAALGVLGAVLGLWKEGCRPDSKDAQGPKPRPQQECNKNGRESHHQ